MWQAMDWGWGTALHMFLWWLLAVLGVAAVLAFFFLGRSHRQD